MAPTPYTPSGRIEFQYVVNTLLHKARMPVDITAVGGSWVVNGRHTGAANKTALQIADMWWTLASAFYPSSVLTPTYVLYQRSGLAFIPVVSGAMSGGPGTAGGSPALASQLTFTFADVVNRRVNHMLFETVYLAPGKSITNSTPAPFAAFQASLVTPTILGNNLNDYIPSRGDVDIARILRWTNALNREIRKRRALA